ncbi:E3 ubiquitin-protein ligase rnf152 [Osmerus eperlanus]|uniref:E3 ubiquitin-protein ligase rnf152 n=1 Tax=Osmerus eperlanus TaxID=29151 RepID=UPI002E137CB6
MSKVSKPENNRSVCSLEVQVQPCRPQQNRPAAIMEAASPDCVLECGICLNIYSSWRRAKLLECSHSCCSFCLRQMTMARSQIQLGANQINQNEMRGNQSETTTDQIQLGANQINQNEMRGNQSETTTDQNEMGANRTLLMTEQNEMGTNLREITELSIVQSSLGRNEQTVKTTSCVIRCPWCRHHTPLPASLSISHLPDDPDKMAAVATVASQRAAFTSVFINMLPSTTCYLFPPPGGRSRAREGQEVPTPGTMLPKGRIGGSVFWERGLRVGETWGESERGLLEEEEASMSTSRTKVCAVVVVGVALFVFVCFFLTMVNCNSTRFRMISCN